MNKQGASNIRNKNPSNKNMGNVWKRICIKFIHSIPKLPRLQQLTFFSTTMDYVPDKGLICIDGQYYRFYDCNKSHQDEEQEYSEKKSRKNNESDISSNTEIIVTDVQLLPHSEGKYQHSFCIPR